MGISDNWEKRRVETFESRGSIARRSFVRSVLTWATDLSFSGRPLSERITAAPSFSTYPFSLGRSPALRGTTVETARPGAAVSVMRFAFASCQQLEHGYYTAYRHISEEDLDLVVHLGDCIYEYGVDEYLVVGVL